MQEQFIPYELAVKLKELGFKEECLARYCVVTEWEKPTGEVRLQINSDYPNNNKTLFKAPLWQQAFDWFSEEYKINNFTYRYIDGQWCFEIFRDDFSDCWGMYSSTKGEARQACLEKLIELCKKN